jgi:hypothetical protein
MPKKGKPGEAGETVDGVDLLAAIPEPYQSRIKDELILGWNQLSAFSYRSFLEQRRGLVLVDLNGCHLEYHYLSWKRLKADWHNLMLGSDEIIKTLIRKYVPTYNPELEVVVLLTYTGDGDAFVMKATKAAVSFFSQPTNSIVPVTLRYEHLSPKEAYEQSGF